jgi:hypothetical protein
MAELVRSCEVVPFCTVQIGLKGKEMSKHVLRQRQSIDIRSLIKIGKTRPQLLVLHKANQPARPRDLKQDLKIIPSEQLGLSPGREQHLYEVTDAMDRIKAPARFRYKNFIKGKPSQYRATESDFVTTMKHFFSVSTYSFGQDPRLEVKISKYVCDYEALLKEAMASFDGEADTEAIAQARLAFRMQEREKRQRRSDDQESEPAPTSRRTGVAIKTETTMPAPSTIVEEMNLSGFEYDQEQLEDLLARMAGYGQVELPTRAGVSADQPIQLGDTESELSDDSGDSGSDEMQQ